MAITSKSTLHLQTYNAAPFIGQQLKPEAYDLTHWHITMTLLMKI